MPDKHAFLSPSSSERWYHCTRSAWLCEQFPDLGSVFAAEGTEAHSLCEYLLGKYLGRSGLVDPRPGMQYYTPEMEECCQGYKWWRDILCRCYIYTDSTYSITLLTFLCPFCAHGPALIGDCLAGWKAVIYNKGACTRLVCFPYAFGMYG